jgi:hypothetical protein
VLCKFPSDNGLAKYGGIAIVSKPSMVRGYAIREAHPWMMGGRVIELPNIYRDSGEKEERGK